MPIAPLTVLILTICTMLSTVMQALDSTIANVALPYMQGTMAASQDEINWVLTSYIVAAAIMTAPVGFLASRFGRTRLFVGSIIGFTLASALCGAAQTLSQIVLFRILQGMCGAALVPLAQSVMFDIYPLERRGAAMSLWSVGVQIGPIFGPILGGWLTQNYNWRWIFYINVPFGVAAALGMIFFLKETPRSESAKLDWVGFSALSLAIGAFQLMLDRGEELDWFSSPEIIAEAILAGLGLYIFIVRSSLDSKPFLSPRVLADVNFVIGTVFIFIVSLVLYSTLALLAPYLQTLMGYPVVTAGFALAPRGVGTIVAALLCGRLINKVRPRTLVGVGFAVNAVALYNMVHWTPDVSEATILAIGVVQGFGIGCVFVPLSVVTFSTISQDLRTQGTGIFSLMRNLGSAIGISVTGALLQSNIQVNHEEISAGVTPFNRTLQSGAPAHFWNPAATSGASLLNQEITRQATIISYSNDFKLMLILTVAVLPLVLLIREVGAPPAKQPQQGDTVAD